MQVPEEAAESRQGPAVKKWMHLRDVDREKDEIS